MQRGQEHLIPQALQHDGQPGRQVVINQDQVWIKTVKTQPVIAPAQRLDQQLLPVRGIEQGWLRDLRVQRSIADRHTRLVKDRPQSEHVRQIKLIASMVLRNE